MAASDRSGDIDRGDNGAMAAQYGPHRWSTGYHDAGNNDAFRWPCGGGSSVTQPGYHSTGVAPRSPAQNAASPHGSALSSTISRIQPIGRSSLSLTTP
jgi:hypothetical protein